MNKIYTEKLSASGLLVKKPEVTRCLVQQKENIALMKKKLTHYLGLPVEAYESDRLLSTGFRNLGYNIPSEETASKYSIVEAFPWQTPEVKLLKRVLHEEKKLTNLLAVFKNEALGEDGRLRSTWKISDTSGRVIATDPPVQSVPSDMRRDIFIPDNGNIFVSVDLAQADVASLAFLSQDSYLINQLNQGGDLYVDIAADILQKSSKEITSAERQIFKLVCLSLIYGAGDSQLLTNLRDLVADVTFSEVRHMKEVFFRRFPQVKEFRRKSSNILSYSAFDLCFLWNNLTYSQRLAYPVQAKTAERLRFILKLACDRLEDGDRMVLAIHDSVTLEVSEDSRERAESILRSAVEEATKAIIPGISANYKVTNYI